MMPPRFSIVIPTHNRGHLVAAALRSVLTSDFDGFEVLVSDDQSTDDTREIVASFGDPRVRHIRTHRRLSMADHFEWASQQATGEYFFMLCDDDAVSPDLLTRVDETIRDSGASVVALKSALYFSHGCPWRGRDNLLLATKYAGRTVSCDSRGTLHAMLRHFQSVLTPRANNSFTEQRLAARIRARVGRLFLNLAPDASSSCLVLAHTPTYHLLDEPLHIFGQAPESIGADQYTRRGAPSAVFAAAAGKMFELSPVPVYCVTNIIAESYLQARRAVPELIPPLNPYQLYLGCRGDLAKLEANGVDVRGDQLLLEKWAAELGLVGRVAVAWGQLRADTASSWVGRRVRAVKHVLAPPPIPVDHDAPQVEVWGGEVGFNDIAECAASLPRLRTVLVGAGHAA
jgi:hypothetical protein